MAADFVPLLPSLRNKAASPAFTPANATVPSQPLTTGATVPAAAPAVHRHEPRVEVKRSGERITQITITCRCGETIEVACEY